MNDEYQYFELPRPESKRPKPSPLPPSVHAWRVEKDETQEKFWRDVWLEKLKLGSSDKVCMDSANYALTKFDTRFRKKSK